MVMTSTHHAVRSDALRSARGRRELTQAALAAASGVSRATIAALELGTRKADVITIGRLADALGVDSESLIDSAPCQLLSTRKVAEILDCSIDTVRRRIEDGTLTASRVGRLVRVHADSVARIAPPQRLPAKAS